MEQKYKNLDFSDLFVTAFKGLFSNMGSFMAVVAMNFIPMAVMLVSAFFLIGMETINTLMVEKNAEVLGSFFLSNAGRLTSGFLIVGALTFLASIVFGPAAYAANAKIFEQYYLGEKMSFSEAFSYGFSKWTNTFVTGLLVTLINMGLLVGTFLIGMILGVVGINPIVLGLIGFIGVVVVFGFILTKLSFCMPLTVLQDLSPGETIGTSFEMTKGRFWTVLGYIFGGTILIGIITGVPPLILMMMPIASSVVKSIISLFSSILVTNFMTGFFIRIWEEDHPVIQAPHEFDTEAVASPVTNDDIQF